MPQNNPQAALIDPLMRISEAREWLKQNKIIIPVPSLNDLKHKIDTGKLKGKQLDNGYYYIFQSSLFAYAKELQS